MTGGARQYYGLAYRDWIWPGASLFNQLAYASLILSMAAVGDGGLYDPLQDKWTPMVATKNFPSRRELHTAVWTDKWP